MLNQRLFKKKLAIDTNRTFLPERFLVHNSLGLTVPMVKSMHFLHACFQRPFQGVMMLMRYVELLSICLQQALPTHHKKIALWMPIKYRGWNSLSRPDCKVKDRSVSIWISARDDDDLMLNVPSHSHHHHSHQAISKHQSPETMTRGSDNDLFHVWVIPKWPHHESKQRWYTVQYNTTHGLV